MEDIQPEDYLDYESLYDDGYDSCMSSSDPTAPANMPQAWYDGWNDALFNKEK